MRTLLFLALPALAVATDIADPEKFVTDVYRRIAAAEKAHKDYNEPDDIYTPRLKALFAEDKRRAGGEVGCLEMDFWVNGQDIQLKGDFRITSRPVPGKPDRLTVIASFVNFKPQEIHFEFQRINGKWLLDDVESLRVERWTLSKLLHCW